MVLEPLRWGTMNARTNFTGGEEFESGNRWNDLHYTSAAMRAARAMTEPETNGRQRRGSDAA